MNKGFDKDRVDNFLNGGVATKNWLYGFFEAEVSFSVYINLISNGNKKYVLIKPYITIQAKDKEVVKRVKQLLDVSTNITQKNKSSLHALRIQDAENIDKVLEALKDWKIISQKRQDNFDRFKVAYFEILKLKKIGESWKSFDKSLEDYINTYLPIQDDTKKEYSNVQWISRIKKHFSGEDLD